MSPSVKLVCLMVAAAASFSAAYTVPALHGAASYVYRSDGHAAAAYPGVVSPHGAYYRHAQPHGIYYQQEQALTVPYAENAGYQSAHAYDTEEKDSEESYDGQGDGEEHYSPEYGVYGAGYGHGEDLSHEYGVGNDYDADNYEAHSDKGSKGHKSHQNFIKGEAGNYGEEGHKGHYSKGAGEKSAHYGEVDQYGSQHSGSKGYKGGDFGELRSHSKGVATTGFHNVYHKDEYKKDNKFYDKSDASGQYNKHGSEASHHDAAQGGHEAEGAQNSGYHQDVSGKKGFNSGGSYRDSDFGYNSQDGHRGYYNDQADFSKGAGSSHENQHGYREY